MNLIFVALALINCDLMIHYTQNYNVILQDEFIIYYQMTIVIYKFEKWKNIQETNIEVPR